MIPETAIVNDQGFVAMKYRKLFPLRVRCGGHPNYVTYIFTAGVDRSRAHTLYAEREVRVLRTKEKKRCDLSE